MLLPDIRPASRAWASVKMRFLRRTVAVRSVTAAQSQIRVNCRSVDYGRASFYYPYGHIDEIKAKTRDFN